MPMLLAQVENTTLRDRRFHAIQLFTHVVEIATCCVTQLVCDVLLCMLPASCAGNVTDVG